MRRERLLAPDTGAKPAPDKSIDMGILPDLFGFSLRCAQVAYFQHFSKTVAELDVTPPQFGALILIEANPGISQSAIASTLRFDRSTLVQIIDKLEDRKLVVRETAIHDRRSHALKLTPQGVETLIELKKRVASHEDHMARNLNEQEREQLIKLLGRL